MFNLNLSVIVLTSQNRHNELFFSLKALENQNFKDFEVSIIDDGSIGDSHKEIINTINNSNLNIKYFWKPQDLCTSNSYNIGAKISKGNLLIFICGDIILNPNSLLIYKDFFENNLNLEKDIIYGKYGNVHDKKDKSEFFPELIVNKFDRRVKELDNMPELIKIEYPMHPIQIALGGNFSLGKKLFLKSGGFDEYFKGWGQEDENFALSLIDLNCNFYFSDRVYGEHIPHNREEPFHKIGKRRTGEKVKLINQRINNQLNR